MRHDLLNDRKERGFVVSVESESKQRGSSLELQQHRVPMELHKYVARTDHLLLTQLVYRRLTREWPNVEQELRELIGCT